MTASGRHIWPDTADQMEKGYVDDSNSGGTDKVLDKMKYT